MSGASIPVHAFFGAIYGHFFLDDESGAHVLYDAVHQALKEERYAGLAQTLMDYVAGDVEMQWLSEHEEQAGEPSFTMHTDERGELDLARLARKRSDIYAEAFQVAVARLSYRERPAYDAYFGLVLEAFEQRFGPGSAPLRAAQP